MAKAQKIRSNPSSHRRLNRKWSPGRALQNTTFQFFRPWTEKARKDAREKWHRDPYYLGWPAKYHEILRHIFNEKIEIVSIVDSIATPNLCLFQYLLYFLYHLGRLVIVCLSARVPESN